MKSLKLKIVLAALAGLVVSGCYNDFDTPAPEKLYTDEDMTTLGLTQISIADVKAQYSKVFGSVSGTGTNNNGWENTKTLKFGTLTSDEEDFVSLEGWPEAAGYYIKGKVLSSDRQGNIYKSLYIYDGTAAIELKLYTGLYLDYYLNLNTMESQWVYVRLDGLYLGNYRMMLSIGGSPSDAINTSGTHKYYANSNLDNPKIAKLNVFPGEPAMLEESDILEVDATNYKDLGEKDLARLVRFKDVKVRYAGIPNQNGVTNAPMKNGTFDNLYPTWIVTDWGSPRYGAWYRWAYNVENVRLYGSVLITYDETETNTAKPGVYSIRTSGYSQFAMKPIPRDGTVGTVLGIYGVYGQRWDQAQFQISVSRLEDLDFPAESLLTEAEIEAMTPAESYNPPVKNNNGDYESGE